MKTAGMAWVAPVGAPSLPMIETVGREAIAKVETWTSGRAASKLVMEWEVARLTKFQLGYFCGLVGRGDPKSAPPQVASFYPTK